MYLYRTVCKKMWKTIFLMSKKEFYQKLTIKLITIWIQEKKIQLTQRKFWESSINKRDSWGTRYFSDFQIHIPCKPNACSVNNYFVEGLQTWNANIDIKPVFNHYKAVTYMYGYFSKTEDEDIRSNEISSERGINWK